jgi:hypothetical protein
VSVLADLLHAIFDGFTLKWLSRGSDEAMKAALSQDNEVDEPRDSLGS